MNISREINKCIFGNSIVERNANQEVTKVAMEPNYLGKLAFLNEYHMYYLALPDRSWLSRKMDLFVFDPFARCLASKIYSKVSVLDQINETAGKLLLNESEFSKMVSLSHSFLMSFFLASYCLHGPEFTSIFMPVSAVALTLAWMNYSTAVNSIINNSNN